MKNYIRIFLNNIIIFQEFLLLDELPSAKEWQNNALSEKAHIINGVDKEKSLTEKSRPTALVMCGVSASWLPDPIVDTVRNISLTIQPGQFIGIAGPVGAGKVSSNDNDYSKQFSFVPIMTVVLLTLPLGFGSIF